MLRFLSLVVSLGLASGGNFVNVALDATATASVQGWGADAGVIDITYSCLTRPRTIF